MINDFTSNVSLAISLGTYPLGRFEMSDVMSMQESLGDHPGHSSRHALSCVRLPELVTTNCLSWVLQCAGIISDVQYADIPDGASFNGVPRYYRSSLTCLRQAVSHWRNNNVDFCIHMGDILDGFNPQHLADSALEKVIAEFDKLQKPHYHMLGNHCLYNLSRPVKVQTVPTHNLILMIMMLEACAVYWIGTDHLSAMPSVGSEMNNAARQAKEACMKNRKWLWL